MKGKDKSSVDALLKLLPALAMSYPGLSSLLGQLTGSEGKGGTAQIQEAVPKITQALAGMDEKKREELVNELLRFFPDLEKVLKQGEGKK